MRDAVLTVSPNRQYRGTFMPRRPATTTPITTTSNTSTLTPLNHIASNMLTTTARWPTRYATLPEFLKLINRIDGFLSQKGHFLRVRKPCSAKKLLWFCDFLPPADVNHFTTSNKKFSYCYETQRQRRISLHPVTFCRRNYENRRPMNGIFITHIANKIRRTSQVNGQRKELSKVSK